MRLRCNRSICSFLPSVEQPETINSNRIRRQYFFPFVIKFLFVISLFYRSDLTMSKSLFLECTLDCLNLIIFSAKRTIFGAFGLLPHSLFSFFHNECGIQQALDLRPIVCIGFQRIARILCTSKSMKLRSFA